jgi:hypothetical protein
VKKEFQKQNGGHDERENLYVCPEKLLDELES